MTGATRQMMIDDRRMMIEHQPKSTCCNAIVFLRKTGEQHVTVCVNCLMDCATVQLDREDFEQEQTEATKITQ